MLRAAAALFGGLVFAVTAPNAAGDVSQLESITITAGGTYTGDWVSTDTSPAVRIATAEPVVIVDSTVKNVAGGTLIESPYGAQSSVTLVRVSGYGGSGRFYEAENFRSITIRNCTIDRTSGIRLVAPVTGSSVLIARTRHRNIQRGDASPGNFVQLVSVQNARVEIKWNEVLNEYNKSHPEDLISVYQSAHLRLHDNYFQHQSTPGNAYNTSSQNGITIEAGAGTPPTFDNEVSRNRLVDGMAIGIFGGHDNYVHHNRVVQDGRLPDGTRIGNGWQGMWIAPGGINNRAVGNVVGYVNRDLERRDFAFPGWPPAYSMNTRIRGKVTRTTELAEWKAWQATLAVKRIRVGA